MVMGVVKQIWQDFVISLKIFRFSLSPVMDFVGIDTTRVTYVTMEQDTNQVVAGQVIGDVSVSQSWS